ncbi:MAG: hydrogenase maturation nickel metallochaperone HypA [Clostridia bacterium]|nr:hydrogenase maturation nickel metallochaperone HypA [Clostridia bacterium]
MHELGIVRHVIKTLEDVAAENDVRRIGSVTLQIGEVSGVIVEQLVDCWNYFREKSPVLKGAEMKVETVAALTRCTACEKVYKTVPQGKICPACGSAETYLLCGNEFTIKEIEAELNEDPPAEGPEELIT